jgi:hypothetical protein
MAGRHVILVAAGLAAGACGRINYDPLGDDDGDDAAGIDADDTDAPDGGPCPAGYVPTSGSCYRVESTPRTWLAAETDCEDDGAGSHLATLIDVDEHFALHDLATLGSGGAEIWIGYTDRVTEGAFLWVSFGGLDPSTDSCFLGTSFANNAGINCVVQLSATQCMDWFVRDCGLTRPYICEHDGRSADPGSF